VKIETGPGSRCPAGSWLCTCTDRTESARRPGPDVSVFTEWGRWPGFVSRSRFRGGPCAPSRLRLWVPLPLARDRLGDALDFVGAACLD
jgi:hypothetical protein